MIFLALAFALCTAGVAPAADYKVTDLGISCPTQGTVYGSYPMSVNDSGQVVGYISVTTATNGPAQRTAYYSGGQWIDIGDALAPGDGITAGSGVESMATCINDNALVYRLVGQHQFANRQLLHVPDRRRFIHLPEQRLGRSQLRQYRSNP